MIIFNANIGFSALIFLGSGAKYMGKKNKRSWLLATRGYWQLANP
jgi:hypothetical protein